MITNIPNFYVGTNFKTTLFLSLSVPTKLEKELKESKPPPSQKGKKYRKIHLKRTMFHPEFEMGTNRQISDYFFMRTNVNFYFHNRKYN